MRPHWTFSMLWDSVTNSELSDKDGFGTVQGIGADDLWAPFQPKDY